MAISLFLQVIGMNSRAYYSPNCRAWENQIAFTDHGLTSQRTTL